MTLFLLLAVLFVPSIAHSQVACFQYTDMLSCNTTTGITNVVPLGPSGGVITEYGSGRNTMEPYTIISPSPRRSAIAPILPPAYAPATSRRSSSYDLDLPRLHELPDLGLPGLPDPEMELP